MATNPYNTSGQITQGQNFYQNGQNVGTVQFDPNTGQRLSQGQITNTIGSNVLNSNQTPLKTPPSVVNTGAAGIVGSADAYSQQQAAIDALKSKDTGYSSDIKALFEKLGLQGDYTNQAYAAEGVDTLKSQVTMVNDQLLQEQRALIKQQEAIRNNSTGALESGVNVQLDKVSRDSASKQADLLVSSNLLQGKYKDAIDIADRKIQMQFEPLKTKLDALKFFYSENKDSLTKLETRQYEEKYKKDFANYGAVMDLTRELTSKLIENGAPSSTYTAMNGIVSEFNAGKITAQEAQSKMAVAVGTYAAKPVMFKDGGGSSRGAGNSGGGGTYANDLDAIVGSVLSTIPSKFGQETFRNQIANARNDADKMNLVASQVLKGQPAEFKNDFRNQAIGVSMLDKAIAELDNDAKTGVINNATQYAFNLVGKDFDPKLAKINGYITSAIQPYRNSVTGAAWGDQEDAEYQQLFGSTKYSPVELRQRLVQTKELLKSKSASGLNSFVNPLDYYNNPFNSGGLAPANSVTTVQPTAKGKRGFWSSVGNWLWGN